MHSSTSNSNSRLPGIGFNGLWLAAVLLALICLVALEITLRNAGCKQSFSDTLLRWSQERSRVDQAGPDDLVVIGASRAHCGINPGILSGYMPDGQVIFLPEDATYPMEVLEDIADNTGFKGTVIFSASELALSNQKYAEGERGKGISSMGLAYYRNNFKSLGRLERQANLAIETGLQSAFVLAGEGMTIDRILGIRSRQPWTVEKSRYRYLDKRKAKAATFDTKAENVNIERITFGMDVKEAFETNVENVGAACRKIAERGGRVIILRMPLSGKLDADHRSYFPRDEYWDTIAPATGCPTIYWSDIEGMPAFDLPDQSHLNGDDATVFTELLAKELGRLGFLGN